MQRIVVSLGCTLAVIASCTLSHAQITPGVTLDFDAASDVNGNATWEATTGGGLGRNWSFPGSQSTTPVADASTPGITSTFNFPGARGTTATYNGFNGSASTQDATFEVWLSSPDLLDRHVLFETGGNGNGAALELNGNLLTFTTQTGTANRLVTGALVSDLSDRFHQVVGTVDLGANEINLYFDGQLVGTASGGSLTDYAGGDNSGLGTMGGGSLAGIDNGINSRVTDFNGAIAINRFYQNKALTGAEVQDNYDFVANAAPGTATAPFQLNGLAENWDAAVPGDVASQWKANIVAGTGPVDWTLAGSTPPAQITGIDDGKTTISTAFSFDNSGGNNSVATSTVDWDSGGTSGQTNATIEMWVRPNDLSGNEILWEVGGTTDGASIRLEDNMLFARAIDNGGMANEAVVEASADISSIFQDGDFMQIVAEIDLALDQINLYVDGELQNVGTTTDDLADYAGTDNNGLGGFANAIGGDPAGTFDFFDGDIAILRFYEDTLLGEDAVRANFDALLVTQVPEPSSVAIWALIGLGLTALGVVRQRRVRK